MRILGLTLAYLIYFSSTPWEFAGAADGFQADYIGGTEGSLPGKTDGKLRTNGQDVLSFQAKKGLVQVSYAKINLIEYGQKVDRRYVAAFLISPLFLLSKSRRHFVTVGYTDDDGRQQAMVFQVSKGSVRSVLVSLEARTGLKVQFQDGEARKAGKG
ncbi:MAG: hypothetical protein ABJF23_20470 [Bryobacteraceae bacterium]